LAYLTGVPPSIVAQMVAKGEIKGTGVLPPENCVPPEAYLKELVNRGIEVLETIVVSRPFHNRRGIMREVDAEQLSR
jgi:saccharopine dehydrogenase-like NADP-dependent oxidoreductase